MSQYEEHVVLLVGMCNIANNPVKRGLKLTWGIPCHVLPIEEYIRKGKGLEVDKMLIPL